MINFLNCLAGFLLIVLSLFLAYLSGKYRDKDYRDLEFWAAMGFIMAPLGALIILYSVGALL